MDRLEELVNKAYFEWGLSEEESQELDGLIADIREPKIE